MNITSYKNFLLSHGATQGQVKRNQSDMVTNISFTRGPEYKRVYILTKDGWKWEDAKYQAHSTPSIVKDPVDYYLQFRPKVHYPIGSYVIVPDDTSPDINLTPEELLNPFLQPTKNRTQWWIIVGRDDANDYVKYMILKCDWEFRWVYQGQLMTCWGCSKTANSYTSGRWIDDISSSLDDLTASWLPDTHYTYGEELQLLGLCDTRTIMHGCRFFMSNNDLDPKVYEVTKIKDIVPQGIIKLTIKQDELRINEDNVELRVCDYYTPKGVPQVDSPVVIEPYGTSRIYWLYKNAAGELEKNTGAYPEYLEVGKSSYFLVEFSEPGVTPLWRIELLSTEELNGKESSYYEGLLKLTSYDDNTLVIKPGKAKSLKGKWFRLHVEDAKGHYSSSIDMEVVNDGT